MASSAPAQQRQKINWPETGRSGSGWHGDSPNYIQLPSGNCYCVDLPIHFISFKKDIFHSYVSLPECTRESSKVYLNLGSYVDTDMLTSLGFAETEHSGRPGPVEITDAKELKHQNCKAPESIGNLLRPTTSCEMLRQVDQSQKASTGSPLRYPVR